MKFNWGTGIFIMYGGFAAVTLGLVAFSMTRKVDLVNENYYDKELKYENQIQKQKNLNRLDEKITVEIDNSSLKLTFPRFFHSDSVKGDILFYRPSGSQKDKSVQLKLNKEGKQTVDISKYDKGMWKLQFNWLYSGKEYYQEESLFIQ